MSAGYNWTQPYTRRPPRVGDPYANLFAGQGATRRDLASTWADQEKADAGVSRGNDGGLYYQRTSGPETDMSNNPAGPPAPGTGPPAQPGTQPNPNPDAQPAGTQRSPFGYTYQAPGADFNPWWLYNDGRQDNYNLYDYAADTIRWDAGRGDGTTENTRDRVWRWTLDELRALGYDPGQAPLQAVQAVFLNNVARARRDFEANNYDWNQSGFARYQANTAAPGTSPAQPGTATAPQQPQTTPPQTTPPAGGQTGGGNPVTVGESGGGGGVTGTPAGSDPNTSYWMKMQADKGFRASEVLRALGLDTADELLSYGGETIANRAPGLFENWRQTQGMGNLANPSAIDWTGLLKGFTGIWNQPGAIDRYQQDARAALAQLPTFAGGLGESAIMPLVAGFNELANYGVNDVVADYRNNLAQIAQAMFQQEFGRRGAPTDFRYLPWLAQQPTYRFLTGR